MSQQNRRPRSTVVYNPELRWKRYYKGEEWETDPYKLQFNDLLYFAFYYWLDTLLFKFASPPSSDLVLVCKNLDQKVYKRWDGSRLIERNPYRCQIHPGAPIDLDLPPLEELTLIAASKTDKKYFFNDDYMVECFFNQGMKELWRLDRCPFWWAGPGRLVNDLYKLMKNVDVEAIERHRPKDWDKVDRTIHYVAYHNPAEVAQQVKQVKEPLPKPAEPKPKPTPQSSPASPARVTSEYTPWLSSFLDDQPTDKDGYLIDPNYVLIHLTIPQDTPWSPDNAKWFLEMIYRIPSPVRLEIVVRENQIKWQIGVERPYQQTVETALSQAHPHVTWEVTPRRYRPGYYWHSHLYWFAYYQYKVPHQSGFLFPGVEYFKSRDPLVDLVRAVALNVKGKSELLISLVLSPPDPIYRGWLLRTSAKKVDFQMAYHSEAGGVLPYAAPDFSTMCKMLNRARLLYLVEPKTKNDPVPNELGFSTKPPELIMPFEVFHSDIEYYDVIRNRTLIPVMSYEKLQIRRPAKSPDPFSRINWDTQHIDPENLRFELILDPEELASFWHLPHKKFDIPGVWVEEEMAIPEAVKQPTAESVIIGHPVDEPGEDLHLRYEDRETHINIVGTTKVGKTTLIHNLAHQDIANGHAVAVISPHVDVIRDIVARSIPKEREKDLILFHANNPDKAMSFNILAAPKGVTPETVASQALQIIKIIFEDEWHKGQMENAFYNALITLAYNPGSTLLDLVDLFTIPQYRARMLKKVKNPGIQKFWSRYELRSDSDKKKMWIPLENRLGIFYRNPILQRILCQPGYRANLNIQEVIDHNKILLVSLDGFEDFEQAPLGAILIAKFQLAVLGRGSYIPDPKKRPPVYLYIDEVQNFASSSLPVLFSEARKYRLSLTTANQYLTQLSDKTIDAIYENVGTHFIFRVGARTAQKLSPYVSPKYSTEDLVNFDLHKCITKLQVAGQTQPAFTMMTRPEIKKPANANQQYEQLKKLSNDLYCRPSEDIDAAIIAHSEAIAQPEPSAEPSPQPPVVEWPPELAVFWEPKPDD